MAKGKKGKIKIGLLRKEIVNIEAEKEKVVEEGEVSNCLAEPQENIASFFKPEEIQELISILQRKDVNDLPVLIAATILGKNDLAKTLLKDGVNIECKDQNGMSPLLWAIKYKNLDLIETYIEKGADITVKDEHGDDALIHAVKSTDWDENSVIKYHDTYKDFFDPNHKNKVGNTAFHFAVRKNWVNFCGILIDMGIDVNCINEKGVSGIIMAGSKGYEALVELLLKNKADVLQEDERGCTSLCYAISRCYQKKAEQNNVIVNSLLNAFPVSERKNYLKRRLQILMNPGKQNDSGNVIDTFLSPVFSYFISHVQEGLDILLKHKVFDVIFQALKNQIGQIDYTISILKILAEVLNYCECCVQKSNPNILEDDLYKSFLNSQCPKMCAVILKHSGISNLRNIACATFLPLFLACPTNSTGRKWLQNNYPVLQPFYYKFVDSNNVKYNIHFDDAHLKLIKKRAKNFRSLMNKLQNGEKIDGDLRIESYYEKGNEEPILLGQKKFKRKSKVKTWKKGNFDLRASFKKSGTKLIAKPEKKEGSQDQITEIKKCHSDVKSKEKEAEESYDPSDLFGLLATTQSHSSEDSEMEKSHFEKEKNRLKQVATAMNSIFSGNDNIVKENDVDDFKLKRYLNETISDESLEPVKKDLTPALNYLQSLFEDFTGKYRKVWNYERMNNYPKFKKAENEDETNQFMKLKAVLPQLEDYYLNSLRKEWELLLQEIRNKEWLSEEASNDIISKLQELLLKTEDTITDKLRKIDEEETKRKSLERKFFLNEKCNNQNILCDFNLILNQTSDFDFLNRNADSNLFTTLGTNILRKTHSQSKFFDEGNVKEQQPMEMKLSQDSNGMGPELNTIYINKGYKSDSHSEIVSIGSSQSIPTPRLDEDKKDQYNLWNKDSENPLEKFLKNVRCGNEKIPKSSCYSNEIINLKKMIANSSVRYGDILLPNPLKSGKILLPFGETGYFGSVEMGLDQKGIPMAVKHVKKSFPMSVNIISAIMIRLKKINNKYLLPYYMADGFEPIIATPLMDFNLGQYILHMKTNATLELKAPQIVKEMIAGIHYLHTQIPPIIHGNLKPSNVFVDAMGTIKLAEFGISTALYLKKPAPLLSMIWWPGEVIAFYIKENKMRCTLAADVATAGMLIHFVITGGQHPFGQQVKEIVDNLMIGKWNLTTFDSDVDDLISWMLIFQPENRPHTSAIVRHIYFWSLDKRWIFLLTCSGALLESGATMHDISQLHAYLDVKAKENNIQGDWKSLIITYFPNCKDTLKNFSPSLTGLLNFLRHTLEDRKRRLSVPHSTLVPRPIETMQYLPHYCDLKNFFFQAFPVISLSIYRMLEGTPWMSVPFLSLFNEPYDLI